MAQNYEIDIKRFNGQDYDTLLPTPAAHASTHQADGSDPITLQTGNYGGASIPTSAYQDASVTRAKLATDALYSPVTMLGSAAAATEIGIGNIGKTLFTYNSSTDFVITVPNNSDIPAGAEYAIARYTAKSVTITFGENTKVLFFGENSPKAAPSLTIETYAMVAIKKLMRDSSGVDIWMLTGPAEVVS